jgi:glutathione S-transferase
MMLTIYGVYRSRASRNIWLAEELGLKYRHIPVIQAYRLKDPLAKDAPLNTRSPEFLKINANGKIPAIDDDGSRMCESLAINHYLAKKHGGPLAPRDVAEDGLMIMWSLWAATEVEPHSIEIVYNRVSKPSGERDPKKADAAVAALHAPFATLDKALAASGHLVGGRFTIADINVAEIVRYAVAAPELFEVAPNVKVWLASCHARPKFKAMMAAREKEPA